MVGRESRVVADRIVAERDSLRWDNVPAHAEG